MSRMQHHFDSAPPGTDSTGNMAGFDTEFTDIVDYILRITYRIWEGKQVGLCFDYYSEDCPVYTLSGVTIGAAEVTQNTLATLASFPDRKLHADNIIWGGDDKNGFHTSHLISTEMTNLGDTEYGSATGKFAKIQVIAHCVVKDNRIIEEWLVRDNYSLVEQLGFNPEEIAICQASTPVQERYREWHESEVARLASSVSHERLAMTGDESVEPNLQARLHNIWNARMVGDVFSIYANTAEMHASANRDFTGHEAIAQFYLSFLGTFSELKFSIDYSCDNSHKSNGSYIAVRWTLTGKHTGGALFGQATGATVLILGESQYRFEDNKIVEEWTVFDQLAVMSQIERARLHALTAQETSSQETS